MDIFMTCSFIPSKQRKYESLSDSIDKRTLFSPLIEDCMFPSAFFFFFFIRFRKLSFNFFLTFIVQINLCQSSNGGLLDSIIIFFFSLCLVSYLFFVKSVLNCIYIYGFVRIFIWFYIGCLLLLFFIILEMHIKQIRVNICSKLLFWLPILLMIYSMAFILYFHPNENYIFIFFILFNWNLFIDQTCYESNDDVIEVAEAPPSFTPTGCTGLYTLRPLTLRTIIV